MSSIVTILRFRVGNNVCCYVYGLCLDTCKNLFKMLLPKLDAILLLQPASKIQTLSCFPDKLMLSNYCCKTSKNILNYITLFLNYNPLSKSMTKKDFHYISIIPYTLCIRRICVYIFFFGVIMTFQLTFVPGLARFPGGILNL